MKRTRGIDRSKESITDSEMEAIADPVPAAVEAHVPTGVTETSLSPLVLTTLSAPVTHHTVHRQYSPGPLQYQSISRPQIVTPAQFPGPQRASSHPITTYSPVIR